MGSRSIRTTLARVEANSEQQDELRRDLAQRLERLATQIEGLFTRSVQFRYSAIRQRRRAAVAAMLAPKGLLGTGTRYDPPAT